MNKSTKSKTNPVRVSCRISWLYQAKAQSDAASPCPNVPSHPINHACGATNTGSDAEVHLDL